MDIELLRHTKNVWGQKMLVGVSWDLLWLPFAAAFLFIVLHLLLRAVRRKRLPEVKSVPSSAESHREHA